jgi:uncharacterized protein (TIGR02611 family)
MRPPDPPNGNVWSRALFSTRSRVHRLPAGETVWRVAIALIGLVIVVVGVILLPLPGPGWLIIFVGIGVWATEFAWASRLLTRARIFVSRWTSWVSALPRWRRYLVGTIGCAVVAVFVILGWLWFWPGDT